MRSSTEESVYRFMGGTHAYPILPGCQSLRRRTTVRPSSVRSVINMVSSLDVLGVLGAQFRKRTARGDDGQLALGSTQRGYEQMDGFE